ncbi:MAG TPA: type II toxin-antitoxin system VapB family antitoxin [Longimicrobiales bacterium]|nr:type II toxin-antitoxin system VapB family antitoxin [Longimicrobiales bacterium]
MRTTVDLDRGLLERAKEALGTGTYREAIVRALEEAVARAGMRELLDELEGSDATWDVDELLGYRRVVDGHRP